MLEKITYIHDGVTLTGILGLPDRTGEPLPGILVAHAADGITAGIQERVRRLADLGYVAFAADLYGGSHPLAGAAVGDAMMALRADHEYFRGRIQAAYDVLTARPEVDASRTAAIGYCFGGMAVLELARSGAPVRGVVSYHGLLTTPAPAKPGEVKARILVCTGALDPYAPREEVDALQDELVAAGVDWQLIIYGAAEHAFAILGPLADVGLPGRSHNPSADRQSWAATLAFFNEIFSAESVSGA